MILSASLIGALAATFLVAASPPQPAQPGTDTVITADVTLEGRALHGVEYALRVWPTASVLAELPDGVPVETTTLASGVTGKDGRISVEVDPSLIEGDYFGHDDSVSFELSIAVGDEEAPWYFSAERVAPGKGASQATAWRNPIQSPREVAEQAKKGVGPIHLAIELGSQPSVVELGNEPTTWVDDDGFPLEEQAAAEAAAISLTPRSASSGDVGTMQSCSWIPLSVWDNGRPERFINKIGVVQAKPWIIQTTSSSHTMGIAYKSSSTASWTQNGTSTITTGASDTTHRSMNGRVWNRVNYRQHGYSCNHGVSYTRWQYRPASIHSLAAGHDVISRPSWTGNGCTTYSNGSRSKTQGSNVTFSTGVSLSVLSVSARSSFSTNTKIRWDFNGTARMCGSTKDGWVSAPQAGAFVP